MTADKPDWAEQKAREIWRRPCRPGSRDCVTLVLSAAPPPSDQRCSFCPEHMRDLIAAALRAAEQRGMERAAGIAENHLRDMEGGIFNDEHATQDCAARGIAAAIRAAAKAE